jgi:hypothetical protein|nr:MAG TPA: helix-turn-helix domain protein [Caudoviricetes sp.]
MSKLLINEQPLQVLPSLANIIGLNEAIVLQQLHFFLRISRNKISGRSWVYNTINDWQAEFSFWSVKTVQRTIDNLEKSGLVVSTDKFNKMKMDKTKWYTIDYQKLSEILPENEKTPFGQNDQMETPKKENAFGQNDQMTFGQNDQSNNQRNKNINITPLSPYGESANAEHADEKTKTSKREKISVDYQGVMNAWNEVFNGSPIHLLKTLSPERKKAILKVAKTMLETKDVESCSVEVFKEYFKDFLNQANSRANKFFFGGLDGSGWVAKFNYIMRPETFLNTFEDSL